MSTHNMFLLRNKKNIFPILPLFRVMDSVQVFLITLHMLNKLIPRPLLIFSQSVYLIQAVDINLHT